MMIMMTMTKTVLFQFQFVVWTVSEAELDEVDCVANDQHCDNETADFTTVDECPANDGAWHHYATCVNIEGSFSRSCRPGFTGDAHSCKGE